MAIAEQFAGLQMDQLIGAPLRAAADASTLLANSTADFIQRVGFDGEGNVRTVSFGYQKHSTNQDGTSNLDELKVDVPMLAIVPIPNLQVDEVNILFDMEVKQSERQESSMDLGATVTGTLGFGMLRVSVTGSVSAHQSNTRSSDNSAKYHVDVRATNHGIPEGLARVLDMMAANVAPVLVGSKLKDGNGQELPEQARIKAEKLKALRQEINQIENRLNAARGSLDNNIQQLKSLATTQLNAYQGRMMKLIKASGEDEQKAEIYSRNMDEVNQSWEPLRNQTADMIKLVADTNDQTKDIFAMLDLKELNEAGDVVKYEKGTTADGTTKENHNYYGAIESTQKKAVESQKGVNSIEEELFAKKADYNDVVAGKTKPAQISEK